MRVRVGVGACMHVHMHVCMHVYMHAHMHVHMHVYMHVYMHVNSFVSLHACHVTSLFLRSPVLHKSRPGESDTMAFW